MKVNIWIKREEVKEVITEIENMLIKLIVLKI